MDAEDSREVIPPPKVITVGEAFDTMILASDVVSQNADKLTESANFLKKMTKAFARVAIPIVAGLLLVVGALIFQIELRDDKLEDVSKNVTELKTTQRQLETSLEDAKTAALKAEIAASAAQKALDAAIANSQAASNDSNEAIKRINEIYDTCVVRKEC